MTVELKVSLPDDVYRVLVGQADRCGTQVHRIVSAAVTHSVRNPKPAPKPPREPRRPLEQRIVELHAAGWSDTRIAVEVGGTQSNITRIRRDVLGLPQVGKPGRPPKPREENAA